MKKVMAVTVTKSPKTIPYSEPEDPLVAPSKISSGATNITLVISKTASTCRYSFCLDYYRNRMTVCLWLNLRIYFRYSLIYLSWSNLKDNLRGFFLSSAFPHFSSFTSPVYRPPSLSVGYLPIKPTTGLASPRLLYPPASAAFYFLF